MDTKSGKALYLYINDNYMGPLHYFIETPDCKNEQAKQQTIFSQLKSGTYKIEVKDAQNNIRLSEEMALKINRHTKAISTHNGVGVTYKNECLMVRLSF